jgi:hypothetical protein
LSGERERGERSGEGEVSLQGEGPVGLSESTNYIGAGCGKDIVDSVGGGDDAAAATGGGVAGLPGNDVACFFGMECLELCVSM